MENKLTINEQNIMKLFMDFPNTEFSIREIARLTKITHPTVSKSIKKLKSQNLVIKETKNTQSGIGKTVLWKANQEEKSFRNFKKVKNLERIYNIGLINRIQEEISPNVIVLFGSYSRGEDTEDSDIDIFVQGKEKEFYLKKFERKLNRKINIMFVSKISDLREEFLQNIINGIVLEGFLEVKL